MWSKLALFGFVLTTYARVSRQCKDDVCYSLNIPQETASSGVGDIYFQITGPTNYTWIGLGQGSSMTGSRLFVMYTSADGSNVTVSPRLGTGYNLPQFDNATQLSVLEGSGVTDGTMTANIRCTNCQNWSDSGSMSFQSASATWMHAKAAGDPLNSDDPNQGIPFHGPSYGTFEWDFADAKGGDSPNPFTSAEENSNTGTQIDNKDLRSTKRRILTAHGVLACMAFIIFFPTGAISLRMLHFRGAVWVHVGMQGFAFLMFIIAFGMGIYLTKDNYASETHPTIGKVVLVMLFIQFILGHLHHRFFKKNTRRGYWSHGHLWLGRIVITLGIVNGGLGLELADQGKGAYIAYGVVAGIVWFLYVAVAVYGELTRKNRGTTDETQDQEGKA
ncbi:Integral membrane protein [Lasiodiplodia theobromae]|uniref:Integral membrane protein n=1 Tax=Lasiodiplodia theobromae TaxID=45133 RepID=UPI0015C3B72A|nr:Integral membrane protein [Lasiodiplodia theobromae]KAF4545850.1 Integral membrane protein [Lasiodiplodia theobromae]